MSASQTTYGAGPSASLLAGMVPDSRGGDDVSRQNRSKVAQVQTVQATATTASFTAARGGVTRTFSVTGAASNNAAAAALLALFQADPIASGWASGSVATDTITFNTRDKGAAFSVTMTDVSGTTVSETTAASDGAEIEFGLFVMEGVSDRDGDVPSGTLTAAVAQISTATPVAANNANYYAGVRMTGGASEGQTFLAHYLSDGTATVQEIVEGLEPLLNAFLPASTVVVTEDNAALTLTAEVAGVGFEPIAGADAAAAVWTLATSTANVAQSRALDRPLAGVARFDRTVPTPISYSGGDADLPTGYPAGHVMTVRRKGPIICQTDDTVADGDPVYVRLNASGSEKAGSVRNDSDSDDAVLLAGAVFKGSATGTASSHALVTVEVNLP